jgi:hypothetical protein
VRLSVRAECAFRIAMDYYSHTKNARGPLEKHTALEPTTLACMPRQRLARPWRRTFARAIRRAGSVGMSRSHLLFVRVGVVSLMLCGAARADGTGPIVDLGLAFGLGSHFTQFNPTGDTSFWGLPIAFETRISHASGHGAGLRVGSMEEFFTFGNPPERTSWLDLTYVYRSIEGRRAGVVLSPAIYLGPTYLYRMAGTNVGTFGAPDRNHHGLGGVAGLSLDLRWTHAYFGLDFSGRYAFGVA